MKHLGNSTEIFIKTLKRQALATGKDGVPLVLDQDLYPVYQLYDQGKLKFQDHVIEAAIVVSSLSSVKVLDESDTKVTGVRNIAQAKLNENEYFCPVAIQVLAAADIAADTNAGMQAGTYAPIDAVPQLANGKVDFIINQTEYLLREMPTSKWIGLSTVGQGNDAPAGMYFLDNFSIMKPNLRNEINFTFGVAAPTTTALKVLLHGTRTQPK